MSPKTAASAEDGEAVFEVAVAAGAVEKHLADPVDPERQAASVRRLRLLHIFSVRAVLSGVEILATWGEA